MNVITRAASWLRVKAATVWRRSLSMIDPRGWRADGGSSDSGEHVDDQTVLALSAVWACVNLLAGTISSLPLMVYRTDASGRRTVARDHPLYRVLHDSPNADQTALDFWDGAAASIELRGNMVAAIERGSDGRVIALTPKAWQFVSVTRNRDNALRYTFDGSDHAASDVLHIRGFGGAPEGGLSTLAYGRQVFGLSRAIDRAAGGMFKNGMRPSGVLTAKDWLTAEQRDEYRSVLEEKFTNALNAGRPMVLEGGTTWTPLTINPEDAQMLQSRGFSIEEVCRYFGVPPFMVGHTEKTTSWGTGLEQQVLAFQKFTLRRRLKRIEQAMEKQLLTPADRAAGVTIEFNLEGLLRGDSAARSAFYQSGLQNGWLTVNEVRERENMPPVPGGDVPRVQMQNVALTESAAQPAQG